MENEIESLLKKVNSILEKSDEIARLKGEKFNIFSILGLETKENQTHSNFIAALLNPKGNHGLGDKFLNLFYETLSQAITESEKNISIEKSNNQNIIDALKKDTIQVKTELSIGKVDYENKEGGRVDIAITGNSGKIFIENKIYAGDQYRQIERYSNKNTVVFYLKLNREPPDKSSSGNLKAGKDFFLLSYRNDIKKWLEKCQKEASDFPVVRETIKQYLILIKKLTGQLTYNEMTKKTHSLIIENINAANLIGNNLEAAKHEVRNDFFKRLREQLKESLNNNILVIFTESYNNKSSKWWYRITIKPTNWVKELYYLIEYNPSGIINYGIVIDNKEKITKSPFYNELKKVLADDFDENRWAWITKAYELFNFDDGFINDFYLKSENDKTSIVKEYSSKILSYVKKEESTIEKVNELYLKYFKS